MAVLLPDWVIAHYLFIAKESRAESGYSEVVMPGFFQAGAAEKEAAHGLLQRRDRRSDSSRE
jgi:hypothetical protein